MSQIIKISEAASIALHALAYLAQSRDERASTRDIAGALGVSEAHLAKVMQRLEHSSLIESKRGPGGGFFIAADPESISLCEIFEIMEGKIQTETCLLGQQICNDQCPLGYVFQKYEQELINHMKNTSLLDFAKKSGVIVKKEEENNENE